MAIECITEARWKPGENTPRETKITTKRNPRNTSAKMNFLKKNRRNTRNAKGFCICVVVFLLIVCVFFVDFIAVFGGPFGFWSSIDRQELLQKLQSLNEELLKRQPMEQRREVWDLVRGKGALWKGSCKLYVLVYSLYTIVYIYTVHIYIYIYMYTFFGGGLKDHV